MHSPPSLRTPLLSASGRTSCVPFGEKGRTGSRKERERAEGFFIIFTFNFYDPIAMHRTMGRPESISASSSISLCPTYVPVACNKPNRRVRILWGASAPAHCAFCAFSSLPPERAAFACTGRGRSTDDAASRVLWAARAAELFAEVRFTDHGHHAVRRFGRLTVPDLV